MHNRAYLTILSKSKNVGLARLAVATFASELDFSLNEIEEIKVAVSEAVTNCIIHGYPDKEDKIEVKMIIKDNELTIVVTDYGVGIPDIDAVLEPSFSTKDKHMGLGLAFIDSFMDDFELESEVNGGTIVTMKKIPERIKEKVE
ncbi:MAG: anti-sigma F factor [Bacillota bacterium]